MGANDKAAAAYHGGDLDPILAEIKRAELEEVREITLGPTPDLPEGLFWLGVRLSPNTLTGLRMNAPELVELRRQINALLPEVVAVADEMDRERDGIPL